MNGVLLEIPKQRTFFGMRTEIVHIKEAQEIYISSAGVLILRNIRGNAIQAYAEGQWLKAVMK